MTLRSLSRTHPTSNVCGYFTSHYNYYVDESGGVLHKSTNVGRSDTEGTISEVPIEGDEALIRILGTINDSKVLSSLSFVIKKTDEPESLPTTHGPFGVASGSEFCIPWVNGYLDGFYGFAGSYIGGIGVYVKACGNEILKTGTFGGSGVEGYLPRKWCFELKGHHLKKITIYHGNQIYALRFATKEDGDRLYPFGGGNEGGTRKDKVLFDFGEEIHSISGTVGPSEEDKVRVTVITSISFVTNKRLHGPFGQERGTPFTVECEYGEFVGFYGICGYYIDSIGVLLSQ
ncbi:hypothetical protein E3N88_35550 [Mikania micrantha]|uniref:Jacalin-type lectin domain-containing protein n=1 Tax=Mikania micrantha TaxID=192012 RepID=A0A5N6M184_9ASTR|nr:hypothetical protein E3N88_35550 [Mikania micrantha]